MIWCIYDKDKVSLSCYISFKDRSTVEQVREWFVKEYWGALEDIAYIGCLDETEFRLYTFNGTLVETTTKDNALE